MKLDTGLSFVAIMATDFKDLLCRKDGRHAETEIRAERPRAQRVKTVVLGLGQKTRDMIQTLSQMVALERNMAG